MEPSIATKEGMKPSIKNDESNEDTKRNEAIEKARLKAEYRKIMNEAGGTRKVEGKGGGKEVSVKPVVRKETIVKPSGGGKCSNKGKAWYNNECKHARKKFHRAKYLYKLHRTEVQRNNLKDNSRSYKKTLSMQIRKANFVIIYNSYHTNTST